MSNGGYGMGGYGVPGGGYGGPPGGGYGAPPGGGYGAPPGGGYGAPQGGGYGGPPGGYGAAPGAYGAAPMGFVQPSSGVEFGSAENAVMSGTAAWAKGLAIVGFVQSAFQLLNLNVVGAIVSLCIAIAFLKGASSLRNVTQTQGNDVHHLITALRQFGTAFMIRIVLTCIGLGLLVIFGVIIAIAAAAKG